MAYAVKDTQQVYVGYDINTNLSAIGDVAVKTNSFDKSVYIQFVNAKSEVIRTDIIKNGQIKYMKPVQHLDPTSSPGVDLSDKLYTHTFQVTDAIPGGVYTLNIVVPDFYPTNTGAVKTISATYVAKASDTVNNIAAGLNASLQGHNDVNIVFTSNVSADTISISEVFVSSLFKLGVTPVANLIKKLTITTEPVWDSVNEEYVNDWGIITKNVSSVSSNNVLYKLQEMEWLLNSYKSNMMKHMNDFYNYMVPQPELLINSTSALPAGVNDLATLDIHYEEPGDGSILSQKNILIIAPKSVINTIGSAINTAQGVAYTSL